MNDFNEQLYLKWYNYFLKQGFSKAASDELAYLELQHTNN